MMTRNVLAIGMAAVLGLATPRALAAPTSDKAYKAAVKLEASGDVTGALAAFEAIPVVQRDFPTRLHIASCKYKLNRLLEAEADWVSPGCLDDGVVSRLGDGHRGGRTASRARRWASSAFGSARAV